MQHAAAALPVLIKKFLKLQKSLKVKKTKIKHWSDIKPLQECKPVKPAAPVVNAADSAGGLLEGSYNEAKNREEFAEALNAWRSSKGKVVIERPSVGVNNDGADDYAHSESKAQSSLLASTLGGQDDGMWKNPWA